MEKLPDVPVWRQPENLSLAGDIGKYLLMAAVTLYAFFAFVRPVLKKASNSVKTLVEDKQPGAVEGEDNGDINPETGMLALPHQPLPLSADEKLQAARLTARQDPRAVANVVKNWVEGQ